MNGKLRGQAAIELAAPTARRMHGQAAMEYLMTYGWALLVIVIVIAILLIINPFSPPQGCRFDQVGFTCNNPVIDTKGQLFMTVTNGNNNAIDIYGVICTADKTPTPPGLPINSPKLLRLQRQETTEVSEIYNDGTVHRCLDANGAELTTISAGAEFSGKVWVYYKNEEDGSNYPMRTVSANIVTKAVAANPSAITP